MGKSPNEDFRDNAPWRAVTERRQEPLNRDLEGNLRTVPVDLLECGHKLPVPKTIHGNTLPADDPAAVNQDVPVARQCRTCYVITKRENP